MKHLKYKGYLGTVEPDFENNILYGKLAFIRDLVTYEAETLADLEREFKTSVDLYLQSWWKYGRSLTRPLKVCLTSGLIQSCIVGSLKWRWKKICR